MKATITIPEDAEFPEAVKKSGLYKLARFFSQGAEVGKYGYEYKRVMEKAEEYLERVIINSNAFRDAGIIYVCGGQVSLKFRMGTMSDEALELEYLGFEKNREEQLRRKNEDIGVSILTKKEELTDLLEDYGNVNNQGWLIPDFVNRNYRLIVLEYNAIGSHDITAGIIDDVRKPDEKTKKHTPIIVLCSSQYLTVRYKELGADHAIMLDHDFSNLKTLVEQHIEAGSSNIFHLKKYSLEFRRKTACDGHQSSKKQ